MNGDSTQTAPPQAPTHHQESTPAEIDALIAKDLTCLSSAEREKVYEDVHGISSQTNEEPGFMNSCLEELEEHLSKLKANTSYELAEARAPDYVRNRDFRLMFIRSEFYMTKAAAERMIKFFDLKKKLFGESKLGREITLDDLDRESMQVVKSGYYQISPYKDMAGRPIILFMLKHKKFDSPDGLQRAGYYMFMSATKMPEAQRKGISSVYYYLDNEINLTSLRSVNSEHRKALPVYFASIHFCYDDEAVWALLCENVQKLNASARARFRPHGGNHQEISSELAAYGIPKQAVPVSEDGKYDLETHRSWLDETLKKERAMNINQTANNFGAPSLEAVAQVSAIVSAVPIKFGSMVTDDSSVGSASTMGSKPLAIPSSTPSPRPGSSPNYVVTPLPEDVLFGRGKTVVEHPGNTRFRHVVDIYMNEYEAAVRLEKTCIASVIVRMVKDANGRFLKRDDGGDWEEVDDSTARKKVAHAFRNRRKLHGY